MYLQSVINNISSFLIQWFSHSSSSTSAGSVVVDFPISFNNIWSIAVTGHIIDNSHFSSDTNASRSMLTRALFADLTNSSVRIQRVVAEKIIAIGN